MAKPWADVAASPEFSAADNATKDAIRQQYFEQIVAPQVPPDKLPDVRKAFLSSTSIRAAPKSDEYDPMAGMSTLSKFVAGYG